MATVVFAGDRSLARGQAVDQKHRLEIKVCAGAGSTQAGLNPDREVVRASFLEVSLEGRWELSRGRALWTRAGNLCWGRQPLPFLWELWFSRALPCSWGALPCTPHRHVVLWVG